jgi:hypothetical protein
MKEQYKFFIQDMHYAMMAHIMNFCQILFGERTHWLGDWVGPRTGLDLVEKRKITALPGSEP